MIGCYLGIIQAMIGCYLAYVPANPPVDTQAKQGSTKHGSIH